MSRNVIFFGNSSYSLPVLQTLTANQIPILAVVTSPDKPRGRHLEITPNPVKEFALKHNLPVFESMKSLLLNFPNASTGVTPIGLVAAYGRIIKSDLLNKFDTRIYNIHPSLLPKYRGPSPLQFQLLDGVSTSGVTLLQMDQEVDHGPILATQQLTVSSQDTSVSLGEKLFALGAELFINFYHHPDKFSPQSQNHAQATFTRLLTKEDGYIDYDQFQTGVLQHNESLFRKFRAFFPWPGVWTKNPEGKRLKLVSIYPEVKTRLEGQS
jgi:methionyl-tRNA formyltransferase